MPMTAARLLRRAPALYAGLLRLGLTGPGRVLPGHVAARGWRVAFTARGIRLAREQHELWVALADTYQLLVNLDAILERAVFQPRGQRLVADLRGLARYRVTQTGDHLWLAEVVELHDCVAGYLARGAPAAGDTVFDCGAYVGEFSIVAARQVGPRGRVIAFEPDARNRATLTRNLAEAGLDNVTICPAGLWQETGEVSFDARGNFRSRIAAVDAAAAGTASIPVLGWDEAVRRFGEPAFTKMDIEGAEIEVLEGAGERLRTHRGRFAIASYHPRDGAVTARRLEPMLRAAGFVAETGHPSHLTTWAWKA
jgi:FkbM family methyltransferase